MANTLQATNHKSRKISLTSVARSLLLFVSTLALLGVLLVVVGMFIILGALIGIVILLLASLLLGGLLLVFKCCSALVIHFLRVSTDGAAAAYAKGKASRHYQQTIKPWLIALLRRFFRWFIPFLLWQLWQWATSSSDAYKAGSQRPSSALPG